MLSDTCDLKVDRLNLTTYYEYIPHQGEYLSLECLYVYFLFM